MWLAELTELTGHEAGLLYGLDQLARETLADGSSKYFARSAVVAPLLQSGGSPRHWDLLDCC
eukprot:scaffold202016_cov23-Prasinocladus_malaysianus.AAC.1